MKLFKEICGEKRFIMQRENDQRHPFLCSCSIHRSTVKGRAKGQTVQMKWRIPRVIELENQR